MDPAAKPLGSTRLLIRLALPVMAAAFVAVAWQGSSVSAARPQPVAAPQISVQTRVVQDSSGLAQLAQLSQELSSLQRSVDATNQAMAAQITTLKASVASLQTAISAAQQTANGAQGAAAGQSKKLGDLAATLTSVNQQLWALQAQFQAQLRKSAGQPSGAATP